MIETFNGLEYLGTFIVSFLAATILPIGSEPFVIYLAKYKNPLHLLIIATVGNSLGSILNYYLGKYLFIKLKEKTKKQVLKYRKYIERFGVLVALFCWLPFIGDFLALGLGLFKVNKVLCFIFITIGKFLRYLIILLPFI